MKWPVAGAWVQSGVSTAVHPLADPPSIDTARTPRSRNTSRRCCVVSNGIVCVLRSQLVGLHSPLGKTGQRIVEYSLLTDDTAGSDVAGLTTIASKSTDGKSYVLNGEKKWITQGQWADHGLVAARTGTNGAKGISVFIVPLDTKRIARRKMENSGVSSSGKIYFLLMYKGLVSSS